MTIDSGESLVEGAGKGSEADRYVTEVTPNKGS